MFFVLDFVLPNCYTVCYVLIKHFVGMVKSSISKGYLLTYFTYLGVVQENTDIL